MPVAGWRGRTTTFMEVRSQLVLFCPKQEVVNLAENLLEPHHVPRFLTVVSHKIIRRALLGQTEEVPSSPVSLITQWQTRRFQEATEAGHKSSNLPPPLLPRSNWYSEIRYLWTGRFQYAPD